MNIRRIVCGLGWLLTVFSTACGTPDSLNQPAESQRSGLRADTGQGSSPFDHPWEDAGSNSPPDLVKRVVCPVLLECYRIEFPDSALLRPLALHRSFTGSVFVAVKVDTASRQLTQFRLQAVRLNPRKAEAAQLRLYFDTGKAVPDSLARLLPLLTQHLENLRPQVLVTHNKACVMPNEWIIPIRIR